jgi:putative transcriptional regulator
MDRIARALVIALALASYGVVGCGDETTRTRWPATQASTDSAAALDRAAAPPLQRPDPGTPPLPDTALAPGRFLIATRQLDGPFFARSVVLLLDYSPTGALGLVINRPTSIGLQDLLPALTEISDRDDRVFMGGPVEPELMVFLIRSSSRPAASQPVIGDIHATGSAEALRAVIEQDAPASRFHAYVGYAGWAPGQLDAEVRRGDWYVTPADPDTVFDPTMADLWERLVFEQEGTQVNAPAPTGAAAADTT